MTTPTPEELLARFCGNALDPREYIRTPFVLGDFVYATNGHIAIRVPAATAPGATATPEKPAALERMFADNIALAGFVDLPLLPDPVPCVTCQGTGWRHECPDCGGEGEFSYGQHDYECAECRGDGQVSDGEGNANIPCNWCAGSGEAQAQPIKVGSQHYQRRYLAMIKALPGARIAPPEDGAKAGTMAYFRFNGGDGLLMPMKP